VQTTSPSAVARTVLLLSAWETNEKSAKRKSVEEEREGERSRIRWNTKTRRKMKKKIRSRRKEMGK
jgi:hypothetical protein